MYSASSISVKLILTKMFVFVKVLTVFLRDPFRMLLQTRGKQVGRNWNHYHRQPVVKRWSPKWLLVKIRGDFKLAIKVFLEVLVIIHDRFPLKLRHVQASIRFGDQMVF